MQALRHGGSHCLGVFVLAEPWALFKIIFHISKTKIRPFLIYLIIDEFKYLLLIYCLLV